MLIDAVRPHRLSTSIATLLAELPASLFSTVGAASDM
jgi:hypothetical protein